MQHSRIGSHILERHILDCDVTRSRMQTIWNMTLHILECFTAGSVVFILPLPDIKLRESRIDKKRTTSAEAQFSFFCFSYSIKICYMFYNKHTCSKYRIAHLRNHRLYYTLIALVSRAEHPLPVVGSCKPVWNYVESFLWEANLYTMLLSVHILYDTLRISHGCDERAGSRLKIESWGTLQVWGKGREGCFITGLLRWHLTGCLSPHLLLSSIAGV